MKSIFHIPYSILLALSTILASCSSSWLTNDPTGDTLTKEQFLSQDGNIRGTVLGIYSIMGSADSQDFFGQRSIDIYGDLQSGDMTMSATTHNWFAYANQGYAYIYRSGVWSYYYRIIRQCNKGINQIEEIGLPKADAIANADAKTRENGYYYAVLLATRGWAYAGLQRLFSIQDCADQDTELSVPIYTQTATSEDAIYGAPRATVTEVYRQIAGDIRQAIAYYDACERNENKLLMNSSVARTTLAYAYLNQGRNDSAEYYAREAINVASAHGFYLLPNETATSTGFNDVEHGDWLWGEDVTVENKASLASFWGHVDIFTYGYARMGDVMGIDSLLYEDIVAKKWDIRALWFNNIYRQNPKQNAIFRYAPDGKFFTHIGSSTWGLQNLDRQYLNDNIYMRLELPCLIGAEAAARRNRINNARSLLYLITDRRIISGQEAAYEDWKNTLTDKDAILDAILYNWRVELWGEGYGMQTFRRYNQPKQLASGQQLRNEGHENPFFIIPGKPAKKCWTWQIPTSEYNHNPFMSNLNDITTGPDLPLD